MRMIDGMWTMVLPQYTNFHVIHGKTGNKFVPVKHQTAAKAHKFAANLNSAPKTTVKWVVIGVTGSFYVAVQTAGVVCETITKVEQPKEVSMYDRLYNIGGKWVSWEYMMST